GSGNTGAEIAYTPAADFNGSDSFMVRVGDGEYTDQAAVNVTVNPVDDAPRGADDYVVIVPGDAGLPITLDVTANDDEVDGQALVLNAVGVPGLSGAARLSGGQVVYTPTLALGETETFTYTVADGGLTDTAVIHAAMVAGDESGSPGETLVNTNLGDNSSIDLTIDIPGNAAPGDAQMTLVYSETAVTDDAPTGFTVAGLAFTLHAYEDGVFTSPYTLANPMTLTIEYSDADVADIAQGEESLLLYYWSGDEWLSDGITPVQRDTDNNRLVFTINHLTDFALFGGDEYQIYLPITVRP
ncbi:MAG: Ig-like domain-containing protein, partial [Anaerolineae bacterium]